ncbi:hypothetical protein BM536_023225 [Streptomyces phaeoluteigriseus]|uniref:Uncharacterized protein n=1 Tax=Streptomyces phaeoluteigriseus TaxID=114686 RepID=A0A1V6MQQ9_9ACTN|nr:hypothetical protein [Streptomyces phaeoluteigriseus]OQD54800.1 hypothetical protein BM536_023225 [Streptomyces phaeoluteigriseus]
MNGTTHSTTHTSAHTSEKTAAGWHRAARSPWTIVCAVAAVVLGPATATASALEQANKAPLHHAVRAEQQAYIPMDAARRRTAA